MNPILIPELPSGHCVQIVTMPLGSNFTNNFLAQLAVEGMPVIAVQRVDSMSRAGSMVLIVYAAPIPDEMEYVSTEASDA